MSNKTFEDGVRITITIVILIIFYAISVISAYYQVPVVIIPASLISFMIIMLIYGL